MGHGIAEAFFANVTFFVSEVNTNGDVHYDDADDKLMKMMMTLNLVSSTYSVSVSSKAVGGPPPLLRSPFNRCRASSSVFSFLISSISFIQKEFMKQARKARRCDSNLKSETMND